MYQLTDILTTFVDRHRPALFSRIEWWFYLLSMPLLLPLGAYFFMGWRYFTDPVTFLVGSLVNLVVYWYTVSCFTLAVRWIISRYPTVEQAGVRTVAMLLLLGVLMAATAIADVWLFSVVPGTGVQFSWDAVRPVLLFGSVISPVFCLALGTFYIYSQWQDRQAENEQLKREAIQQQYNQLKSQVNPHFLFNSLNSISLLISEDAEQAERFVDQLSQVYRYMLQAGTHNLVTLEAELNFLTAYTHLLRVRYGRSLQITYAVDAGQLLMHLSPLTLQTLVDHAIQHNRMSTEHPLTVTIRTQGQTLWVTNNSQRKVLRVEPDGASLDVLLTKYRLLDQAGPVVEEADDQFSVAIPLR